MQRSIKSTWRYMQAAWSYVKAVLRRIPSLFETKLHPLERIVLFIGIAGMIAGHFDLIRHFLPAYSLVKLDAWTGMIFGVVSASFIYKAWWFLQNHERNQDKMQDGAFYAAGGILFLLIAWSFGVKLPFTG